MLLYLYKVNRGNDYMIKDLMKVCNGERAHHNVCNYRLCF